MTLTIVDNDGPPSVTITLDPASIAENGGVSVVTVNQSRRSAEDTVVTVSLEPVAPAAAGDYMLSADTVLTVPAGETTSTGLVTITAVDNARDGPDKTVTVSGEAVNTYGILGNPPDVALTITDDEGTPVVTLHLTPDRIEEAGGESVVTASLDRPSSAETSVRVSRSNDYRLTGTSLLRIAAGETESTARGRY